MTTKFMETRGIPLYRYNGETYCRMIDVMKVIHHEFFETDDKNIQDMLDRMQMRVAKNDLLGNEKPKVLADKKMPTRYAVGKETNGKWLYYVESKDGKPTYSDCPCMAKQYVNYRDASACADFLDGKWDVLDMEKAMTEEERWLRDLLMPMPFDADDGNECAIPIEVIT